MEHALDPVSSALMPSAVDFGRPSWTYLASSPSPRTRQSERVLKEFPVYPTSDGCHFFGGSPIGTSVTSGFSCSCA